MKDNLSMSIMNTMEIFRERLKSVLEDLHNDKVYGRIKVIEKETLLYEDVDWLFMEVNFLKPSAGIKAVLEIEDTVNPELKYIQGIIERDLPLRDKLVLICGYIEPYIYHQLGINPTETLKKDIENLVDKTDKLDLDDFWLLRIYGIVVIIFKNFKNKVTPDKRLPHRNCILHNGIIDYTDEEVEIAYNTLVTYVYMIYTYSNKLSK